MSLLPEERTTTINFDEAGDMAEVVTWSRKEMTKLAKIAGAVKVEDLECSGTKGAIYRIPASQHGWKNPRQPRRVSAETKQRAAARMSAARAARGK